MIDKYFNTFNALLVSGWVIPEVFGINVSDVELNCNDGWFEFGINATPATFQDLADAWENHKKHMDAIEAGEFKTQKWGGITFDSESSLFLQE